MSIDTLHCIDYNDALCIYDQNDISILAIVSIIITRYVHVYITSIDTLHCIDYNDALICIYDQNDISILAIVSIIITRYVYMIKINSMSSKFYIGAPKRKN